MKIHFIGIGGIGISGLAQYFIKKGHQVTGSDLIESEITKLLEEKGAKVFIGNHKEENLSKDTDKVIYSQAIKESNPELRKGKEVKAEIQSYPQALGEITKKKFTIAVAGTHGKSTTASMIALILIKAGLDPTVFLGTKLKEFNNSNFRMGKSKYLVIEADEWKASFLNYYPDMITLTNIEQEHLDYYKDLKEILKAYQDFIKKLPEKSILIANQEDKNIQNLLRRIKKNLKIKKLLKEKEKIKKVLQVPGKHNLYNALAAFTTAHSLEIPDKVILKALSEFKGAWRRFEIIKGKATFVSDYAHHPTEIKATLKAVREKFPKKKVWIVFQPHQFLRTYYLFDDFVKVFSKACFKKLIITDIYQVAGRDQKKKVSSKKLVKEIRNKNVLYIPTIKKVTSFLEQNLKGDEVVVVMGAGNIYKVAQKVIHR